MLIVAGSLKVSPDARDEYVAESAAVVQAARSAEGCLDFSIAADVVDGDRINIYERWKDQENLHAFRGAGPSDNQQATILDADVQRYTISKR